jgi:ABC-type bacteriocin/lantibiotic exporter with double-glycine peptidase domain
MTADDDRKQAQSRATDALRFYDTMRRYARVMLIVCVLTLVASVGSLVRSFSHDSRIERLEYRMDKMEKRNQ